ncbi:universal stress protein [Gordonia sp. CPCC 205515]|uniref:universal stress protein n=1 Tax=Gordonia sp. CPCC 205515 TaxID=3140791 RepID=UPI003AF3600E
MCIIVAVTDTAEGTHALHEAVSEAQRFDTDLVAVNLALTKLDLSQIETDVPITVVDRTGRDERDPADAVLHEIEHRHPSRLVVGVRRRSAVGKAVLGSVSQRLILQSPIPVLAVKI